MTSPQKSQFTLVLSRVLPGKCQRVEKEQNGLPMQSDSYHVIHTDNGRLGTVREEMWCGAQLLAYFADSGKVTGDELVLKCPEQILPKYLVTFEVMKK